MRQGQLHAVLFAHVLWFLRERVMLQKVIDMWTPTDTLNEEGGRSPYGSPEKFVSDKRDHVASPRTMQHRKAINLTKKWLQKRKASRRGTLSRQKQFADLADNKPSSSNTAANNQSELVHTLSTAESHTQDLCCASVVKLLQLWIEVDHVVNGEIESLLSIFSYEKHIKYKEIISDGNSFPYVDLAMTFASISSVPMSADYTTLDTKNMKHLSRIASPGDRVKQLKTSIIAALASNNSVIYSIDAKSYANMSTATFDSSQSVNTNICSDFQQNLESSVESQKSLYTIESNQCDSTVESSSFNLPPAPLPMKQHNSTSHGPAFRTNRIMSKSYTKELITSQTDVRSTAESLDKFEQPPKIQASSEKYVLRSSMVSPRLQDGSTAAFTLKLPEEKKHQIPSPPKEPIQHNARRGNDDNKLVDINLQSTRLTSGNIRSGRYKLIEESSTNILENGYPPGFLDTNSTSNNSEAVRLRKLNDIVTTMIDECETMYSQAVVHQHEVSTECAEMALASLKFNEANNVITQLELKSSETLDPLISPRAAPPANSPFKKPLHTPREPKSSNTSYRSPHKIHLQNNPANPTISASHPTAENNISQLNNLVSKELKYDDTVSTNSVEVSKNTNMCHESNLTSTTTKIAPHPPREIASSKEAILSSYLKQLVAEEFKD
jgi:hypothetical protein